MTYLFPFAGDDKRRPKPPNPATKTNLPTHHPRKIVTPPVVVIEPVCVKVDTPNMTRQMRLIADDVCKRHKVSLADLVSIKRNYKLVHARREYVFRCRSDLGKSFPQIGKSINQDHSTAVHAYYVAAENPKKMDPFKPVPPPPRKKSPKAAPKPMQRVEGIELSERQKIVYEYMLQGMGNRGIAEVMGRSYRQARNDTYEVRCKLKRISASVGKSETNDTSDGK